MLACRAQVSGARGLQGEQSVSQKVERGPRRLPGGAGTLPGPVPDGQEGGAGQASTVLSPVGKKGQQLARPVLKKMVVQVEREG